MSFREYDDYGYDDYDYDDNDNDNQQRATARSWPIYRDIEAQRR